MHLANQKCQLVMVETVLQVLGW